MTDFRCKFCHRLLFRYLDKGKLFFGTKEKYIISVKNTENREHCAKIIGKEIIEIKCQKCGKINKLKEL